MKLLQHLILFKPILPPIIQLAIQFPSYEELQTTCNNWECNRTNHSWCKLGNKYIDFKVYLHTKQMILTHYDIIRQHKEVIKFNPSVEGGVSLMIDQSERLIKRYLTDLDKFRVKYHDQ